MHMARQFHDLDQQVVHGLARDHQAQVFEGLAVAIVELVTVTMALAHHVFAVQLASQRAGLEAAFLCAQAHGAAQVGALAAGFRLAGGGGPLGDEGDDRIGRVAVVLAGIGLRQPRRVAGELDHGRVHAVADAEVRHARLAGELRG